MLGTVKNKPLIRINLMKVLGYKPTTFLPCFSKYELLDCYVRPQQVARTRGYIDAAVIAVFQSSPIKPRVYLINKLPQLSTVKLRFLCWLWVGMLCETNF